MNRLLTTLLTIIISLSIIGWGCKSGFFGKFSGTVVEPERLRPLAGIKVILDDRTYSIETDTGGNFSFIGINAGKHTLTCKTGNQFYEDAIVTVNVRHDAPTPPVVVIAEIKSEAIQAFTKDTVKLSSLKEGYMMFKGGYGFGIIQNETATTNMVMIHNNKKRLVLRPANMKGYVQLKDSAQALEYARLFTDFNTFYLFKDPSPNNSFIEVQETMDKPSYGEMPQAQFKRLGLHAPVVTNDENYFYITRYLISTSRNLYKVNEKIGFDGDYEMKKTLILTHMDISIPPVPVKTR